MSSIEGDTVPGWALARMLLCITLNIRQNGLVKALMREDWVTKP
jgi:hypothetical protein